MDDAIDHREFGYEAATDCEVLALSKLSIIEVMHTFPEVRQALLKELFQLRVVVSEVCRSYSRPGACKDKILVAFDGELCGVLDSGNRDLVERVARAFQSCEGGFDDSEVGTEEMLDLAEVDCADVPEAEERLGTLPFTFATERTESIVQRQLQISGSGSFRAQWDIMMLVVALFSVLELTYVLSFEVDTTQGAPASYSVFVDGVFCVDIVLNFLTMYSDAKDREVTSPRRVATRYLSTWFAVDLVATIPWSRLEGSIAAGTLGLPV